MTNLFLNYNQDSLLLDSELFDEFYSLSKKHVPVAILNGNIYLFVLNEYFIKFEQYNVFQKEISCEYFNEKIILINNFKKWKEKKSFNKEVPIRSIVEFILIESLLEKVTDIHFDVMDMGKFVVKFKKNTILYDFCLLNKEQFEAILFHFKILSSLDPSKKQISQSSSFEKVFKGNVLNFRFSTHPTLLGERFVIRVLSRKNIFDYRKMSFDSRTIEIFENIILAQSGLILFVGPTNSGKTTLIHSILLEITKQNVNIMTLEDPVEYRVPGIIQTNISENGFNFFEGMKSILRQDPDVIFLGEIRDEKTAKTAVQAALTGHKVLSTLHAYSNKGAIMRLNDMNISNVLLSECIHSIVSQRLLKKRDDSGILNIVDICFFDEEVKDCIRRNDYFCLKDNLRSNAKKFVDSGVIDEKELIRVFGF